MRLDKVAELAAVLVKSQLRAGRTSQAGAAFFRRVWSILLIDGVLFTASAVMGYFAAASIPFIPDPFRTQLVAALKDGLVSVPLLIPLMVLLPGILFELSVSSRFASSDTVNWLPVTQTEYALASSLSVAYIYSIVPSLVLGFTLPLSLQWGLAVVWVDLLILGLVTLFLGGTLVEILRAAVNRVTTAVMKKARKGALLLRLVVTIAVIVVFQFALNFLYLFQLVSAISSLLGFVQAAPIFWAALSVKYLLQGAALASSLFFVGTIGFTLAMVWVAAKVRSRYWVPVTTSVSVTAREYSPTATGFLSRLGFSGVERALIRKDFKGLARRRELVQFFAIPVVFTAALLLQSTATSQVDSSGFRSVLLLPVFLGSSIFATMMSSTSFGQESKAVINLYALPVDPRALLRAKALVSLCLSLASTLGSTLVVGIVEGVGLTQILLTAALGVLLTIEVNFIGLGFGARYPDFQERPRPRFVEPIAIIFMVLIGIGLAFLEAFPLILNAALPGLGNFSYYLLGATSAGSVVVTILAYRWAASGVRKLLAQLVV